MSVRIIIDSTADYSVEETARLGLLHAPLTVHWDGQEYRDGIDITPAEFYPRLQKAASLPTTSQVPVSIFEGLYQQVLEDGDDAVVITLSQNLSGTYQSATIAHGMLSPDLQARVKLVDSGSASLGAMLLINHAISMRDSGSTATEIASALQAIKPRLVIYACVETLKFLHKGGRLSAGAAVVGTLLSVKPVLRIQDGKIEVAQKVRGNAAAYRWLVGHINGQGYDTAFPLYLGSTQCPELVQQFVESAGHLPVDATARHCDIGAVIGTHIGPGTVGIAYIEKA